MSNDSHLFTSSGGKSKMRGMLPLYEAKLFHQFDHRWATYRASENGETIGEVSENEKNDVNFAVSPRYFVSAQEVKSRLKRLNWPHNWLISFRDIASPTNVRTMLAAALPLQGVGNGGPLILCKQPLILLAQVNSLVFDYLVRQKCGGTHLNYYIIRQNPMIPPGYFNTKVTAQIERIVTKLQWPLFSKSARPGRRLSEEVRAKIRAELDAFFAAAYGLNRHDLAFILDPQNEASTQTPHPSETFSILKRDEMKSFGEYRTERLVLEAWDRMAECNELPEPYTP